ncbi:MAG: SMI1/KNR4 family protein [Ruminococcus sp.]|nr:SMI1/KNR4 family protein [Ruminococcus sp.]
MKIDEQKIIELESRLNIIIPDVYKSFLAKTNGKIFDNVFLYDIYTLEEMYHIHQFNKYAPDYFSIGNDNGDYEVIMKSNDRKSKEIAFLEQGSIGSIQPDNWYDFNKWFADGCNFNIDDETEYNDCAEQVKIILFKVPDEKLKMLMKIRKLICPEISLKELLLKSNNLPSVLTDKFCYETAKGIIDKENLSEFLKIEF